MTKKTETETETKTETTIDMKLTTREVTDSRLLMIMIAGKRGAKSLTAERL